MSTPSTPCTKEQLIAAINSYSVARCTNDDLLVRMAAETLAALLDSLTFTEASTDGSQG